MQAVDSRDSMAMALYSQCFAWVIKKINSRIRSKEDFKSIGILDIFGFENFEVGLKSLCIVLHIFVNLIIKHYDFNHFLVCNVEYLECMHL